MWRPPVKYSIIVAILTIIGAFGLDTLVCSADPFGDINYTFDTMAAEASYNATDIHAFQRDANPQIISYIDESHVNMIKKVDGEQTKEPSPRGKLVKNVPNPIDTLRAFLEKLAMKGPSVIDSPCLMSIDQLPLDNRPPPLLV